MANRKYTDSSFVIQTTANISSQWQKSPSVEQIPFSLTPFTAKSATSLKVCASAPFGTKAYVVAQRPKPRDFLFETEKLNLPSRTVDSSGSGITQHYVTSADHIIHVNTQPAGTATAVYLPTPPSVGKGFVITIKDIYGYSNSGERIELIPLNWSSGETIDGQIQLFLQNSSAGPPTDFVSVTVITDGVSSWYII